MRTHDARHAETIADVRLILGALYREGIKDVTILIKRGLWDVYVSNTNDEARSEALRTKVAYDGCYPLTYQEWEECRDLKIEGGKIFRRVEE